ncbi:hypothetical protein JWG45_08255 [Leptospira sp. 201903070]|uniref:DUF3592 domain-containing protein n=1 Tax=Leptospira ainlahdjerensis TaxID=2810033 RepID=A0ABS2UE03_9LEPT|nr:hypothetical protein [Leptospira ainlahdjerensis]MBM9577145.1 hypothetical protein [Leptospira ainlahdjerensis]
MTSILFLTLFFAALPAWFLSTLEGWISVDCVPKKSAHTLECTISERFAFTSRSVVYMARGARSLKNFQKSRKGTNVTYQLILLTPSGEESVLRSPIGNSIVDRIANDLNAALESRSGPYHAKINPDPLFWLTSFLLFLFASVGLLIALFTKRSPKRIP